jgi:hypothetical protein
MHYVVDRLEDCLAETSQKYMREKLEEFKRECIYNLGVNVRIDYKEIIGEDI